MIPNALGLAIDLVVLALGAAGIVALGYLFAWLSEVMPLSEFRRQWLRRVRAPLGLALFFGYLILAVARLLAEQPPVAAALLVVVAIGLAAIAFGLLKDTLCGIALKAAGNCHLGDSIRTQGVTGRITRLGLRTLKLATPEGDELIIPYSRVAAEPLWVTAGRANISPHTFALSLPDTVAPAAIVGEIRRLVLLHHWAASTQPPKIRVLPGGLEITFFTLDEHHAPDIERYLRATLATTEGRQD